MQLWHLMKHILFLTGVRPEPTSMTFLPRASLFRTSTNGRPFLSDLSTASSTEHLAIYYKKSSLLMTPAPCVSSIIDSYSPFKYTLRLVGKQTISHQFYLKSLNMIFMLLHVLSKENLQIHVSLNIGIFPLSLYRTLLFFLPGKSHSN